MDCGLTTVESNESSICATESGNFRETWGFSKRFKATGLISPAAKESCSPKKDTTRAREITRMKCFNLNEMFKSLPCNM